MERLNPIMNIENILTCWLYAYSPQASAPQHSFHTVFVATNAEQRHNGRAILAQTSLSYLTCVTTYGAGALVSSYTPPFGPPWVSKDFKDNSLYAPQAISVTFELAATAAEAWALGTVFLL
jgi:hypothetical protein